MVATAHLLRKQEGLNSLLNFSSLIAPDILLGKDGSLTTGFYLSTRDLNALSFSQRNQQVEHINKCLVKLGEGWTIQVEAIRTPLRIYSARSHSYFPDDISKMIDQERREFYTDPNNQHFETYLVLLLTYLPPLTHVRSLTKLVSTAKSSASEAERIIDGFRQEVASFTASLSSFISFTTMTDIGDTHELLEYLHYTLTGKAHPVRRPAWPIFLDDMLASEDFYGGSNPMIGERFVSVLAITGFPNALSPQILAKIQTYPAMMRWHTRFRVLPALTAQKRIQKIRQQWKQIQRGFMDQVFQTNRDGNDRFAEQMTEDAEEALSRLSSRDVSFGHYNSSIIVHSEEKQPSFLLDLRREIEELGFACSLETVNCVEAFLGSLPSHSYYNLRESMCSSEELSLFTSAAHLLVWRSL